MARGWWTAVIVGALVLASVPAGVEAGSSTDPDVKDPAGDGSDKGRDVVAAWIDAPDPMNLTFSLETGIAPEGTYTTSFALHERWTIWFKPSAGAMDGATVAYVSWVVGLGTTSSTGARVLSSRIGFTAIAGTFGSMQTNEFALTGATITGKVLSVTVPLSAQMKAFKVGTDTMTGIFANVVLVSKGPLGTSATYPDVNTIVQTYDRAPNTGFGRNWPSAPPAPSLAITIAGQVSTIDVAANETTEVPLSLNATANTNVTIEATNVTEGFNISVPDGLIPLIAGTPARVNVTVKSGLAEGATGNATIRVMVDGVEQANHTLGFRVIAGLPSPSSATGGATPSGSSTATSAGSGKDTPAETPGPGLAAGVVALGVALLARRRRSP